MVGAAFRRPRGDAARRRPQLPRPHRPAAPAFDPGRPELMLRSPQRLLDAAQTPLTALCLRAGLGTDPVTRRCSKSPPRATRRWCSMPTRVNPALPPKESEVKGTPRRATTFAHPPPGGSRPPARQRRRQADRIAAAQALAAQFNAHVAPQGLVVPCLRPDGRWRINTTATPGIGRHGRRAHWHRCRTAGAGCGWRRGAGRRRCTLHGCGRYARVR